MWRNTESVEDKKKKKLLPHHYCHCRHLYCPKRTKGRTTTTSQRHWRLDLIFFMTMATRQLLLIGVVSTPIWEEWKADWDAVEEIEAAKMTAMTCQTDNDEDDDDKDEDEDDNDMGTENYREGKDDNDSKKKNDNGSTQPIQLLLLPHPEHNCRSDMHRNNQNNNNKDVTTMITTTLAASLCIVK